MNNLNPIYLLQENMKKRLMKKAINATLPNTKLASGKVTKRTAEKMANRVSKGLSDNGVGKGKVNELANRALNTKKGQKIANDIVSK